MVLGTPARNAAAAAVTLLLDAGSGAGTIKIMESDDTLLATLTFSDPAFTTPPVTGVQTADTITADSSADAAGTAAKYEVLDSDANVIWTGDVGTGSEDIVLNTVSIVAGANVSISSWTVTQPTS